jgi:hypothetical protein
VLEHDNRVRDDSSDGNKDTDDALVADMAAAGHPAERDDRTGLDVTDDSAGYGAGLRDDEELRHVDETSEATTLRWLLVNIPKK